jgi:hypothetical protein
MIPHSVSGRVVRIMGWFDMEKLDQLKIPRYIKSIMDAGKYSMEVDDSGIIRVFDIDGNMIGNYPVSVLDKNPGQIGSDMAAHMKGNAQREIKNEVEMRRKICGLDEPQGWKYLKE